MPLKNGLDAAIHTKENTQTEGLLLNERHCPFGPAEVATALQVSDRTARNWLQEWHAAGLIAPQRPTAQRVHAWVLSAGVAAAVAKELA